MTTLRNNPIAIRYLSFVKESLNYLSKKHCVENHNAFFLRRNCDGKNTSLYIVYDLLILIEVYIKNDC